jgi:hypothetical protein
MFESLDILLNRKEQRFICVKGWPDPSPPEHVVKIEHQVDSPLSYEKLEQLKEQLDELPELISFYSRFGSLRLYSQIDTDKSAYYIADPDEWDELKEYFNDWIEGEDEELLPDWITDFIVIGEIPKSGNYFIVPLTGKSLGHVYEFEHDGFEFVERGATFADFIEKLTVVNDELLENILTHTRYQDERPDSQWIVKKYRYGS